jgi:O-antigen/teichoic acid export membrane protein
VRWPLTRTQQSRGVASPHEGQATLPTSASHLRRLFSGEAVALGLGMLQGLVVARALGPADYGRYALALALSSVVFLILDPRSGDALVRFLSEYLAAGAAERGRAVVRLAFSVDAVWAALGLLLTIALAQPASALLHMEGRADLVIIVALGGAVAAPVATSRALLSVFGEFKSTSRVQIVGALIRTAAVCAVAFRGLGLAAVVWALTIAAAVESALFVTVAFRAARRRLGKAIMASSLAALEGKRRNMLRFVVMADLTSLVGAAIKQVDTLLVGALAGPREAGFYRLAKALTGPAGNVGGPVQAILYPKLARAESLGDYAGADAVTRRTILRLCIPLSLAALCCVPLVRPVIVLVAGDDFQGATAPAVALVVGVAISFATLHLRPIFLARDKLTALLTLTIIPALAVVAGMIPAAAATGATGVAWARTAAVAVGSLMMILYVRSAAGRHTGRTADREQIGIRPTDNPL